MTAEEKQHQIAVGSLLRVKRKEFGYSVEQVVTYCNKVGWKNLTAEKLNRWERGITGHEITGLKTLMSIYGISNKEIVEIC